MPATHHQPTLTRSVAAALVINNCYADQLGDHATQVAHGAPAYTAVLRSVFAWSTGPRSLVCSTAVPEQITLHQGVAADALDAVIAWLDGSPYAIPHATARIARIGPRHYRLDW